MPRGGCTVAAGSLVVFSAEPPGVVAIGAGGTTGACGVGGTGSGGEEVVTGGTETTGRETAGGGNTGGAGNTGTETSSAGRGSERECAVRTSIVTVAPATARHPTATSGLSRDRLGQDCRCLAPCCSCTASQASSCASRGITAGGVGRSVCAALRARLAAAASAPTRSRRARNSSMVKI